MNTKKPPLNLHHVLALAKSAISFVPKNIRLVTFPTIRAKSLSHYNIPEFAEPITYSPDEALIAIDYVARELWKLDMSDKEDFRECLHACAGHVYNLHQCLNQQHEQIIELTKELNKQKQLMIERQKNYEDELENIRYMYKSAYDKEAK